MSIGRILDIPTPGFSHFAVVQDEYGSSYSVPVSELPSGAEAGDDMAYRVKFSSNYNSNLTLQSVDY